MRRFFLWFLLLPFRLLRKSYRLGTWCMESFKEMPLLIKVLAILLAFIVVNVLYLGLASLINSKSDFNVMIGFIGMISLGVTSLSLIISIFKKR